MVRNGESYGMDNEVEAWGGIFCEFAKAMP
jgi:hypothetical protein